MHRYYIKTLLCIVFLFISCSSVKQDVKTAKVSDTISFELHDILPVDPEVTTGTLDNGLTYYIRKNLKPEKRAELRLAVKAGSVLEDDDQQGLAHFAEHMAFNGTKHFEKQELVGYLESIGMRFGPDLNASTSFDETIYMLQVPADAPGSAVVGTHCIQVDHGRTCSLSALSLSNQSRTMSSST